MTQSVNFTEKVFLAVGDMLAGFAAGGAPGSERKFDAGLFQWAEFEVLATSATGGNGNLVLSNITRRPNGDHVFTHGTKALVEYEIAEMGASSYKAERGIGIFTYSSKTLARTKPTLTWDGSTLDTTSPSRISFASSGVYIRLRPAGADGSIPFFNVTTGDDLGMHSAHFASVSSVLIGVADTEWYTPFLWMGEGEIKQAGIYVTTGQAGGEAKLQLYGLHTDGQPGELIKDFTSGGVLDCSSSGAKVVAVTGLWLPKGWYYSRVSAKATSTMPQFQTGGTSGRQTPAGTSAGATIHRFAKSFTYTDPTPNPASTGLTPSTTNTGALLYLKSANT